MHCLKARHYRNSVRHGADFFFHFGDIDHDDGVARTASRKQPWGHGDRRGVYVATRFVIQALEVRRGMLE